MHEIIGGDLSLLNRARKEIGQEIENRTAQLAEGIAKDHAEYSRMCGEIRGRRAALSIMEDIARKILGRGPEGER